MCRFLGRLNRQHRYRVILDDDLHLVLAPHARIAYLPSNVTGVDVKLVTVIQ
jgi:hypothetical protein